jgi:hypothetical protein
MQQSNQSAPVATVEQLKVFFDAVEEIQCKNLGGCLFFCYVFFLWLKKNNYNTDSFGIIQYDSWGNQYLRHNEAYIRGERSYARSSAHFTWLYEGTEYDSEGIYKGYRPKDFAELNGLQTKYGSLVVSFCESALINGNWNPDFQRNEAIDIIIEKFEIVIPDSIRH